MSLPYPDPQAKAESFVRKAADEGANIILLQELFRTPYFCQEQDPKYFEHAFPLDQNNALIDRFAALAGELGVVLPISFFERAGNAFFNSIAIADADGSIVGHYRKSHIPDGPGYQEKFYFSPGDTGFKAVTTRFATLGVCICWDQWFPEAARACALLGADLLLYPTAIGSEPQDPSLNSYPHWIRTMQGHAAANMVPLVASNRIGTETFGSSSITFYGGSFIAGTTGEIVAQVGAREAVTKEGHPDLTPEKDVEGIVMASFDFDALRVQRAS